MTRREWLLALLGTAIVIAWFSWQGYVMIAAPQAFEHEAAR